MLTKLVFISQYVEIPVPCYINLHDAVCQLIKLEKKKKALSCVQCCHCPFKSETRMFVQATKYKLCGFSDSDRSLVFSHWHFKTGIFIFKTGIVQYKE